MTTYAANFLWGAAVLLSWIGLAVVFCRVARITERLSLGLLATLGLGLHVAIGGVLLAGGVAYRWTLIIIVLYSAAIALPEIIRRIRGRESRRSNFAMLLLSTALLVTFAANVASFGVPNVDDWLAYLPFSTGILETGTFHEAFSLRRLTSYGGQTYLDAMTRAIGSEANVVMLERGLMPVVLAMLVWGAVDAASLRRGGRGLLAILAATVAYGPLQRVSVGSGKTAVALILATAIVLAMPIERRRRAILAGVMLAAFGTMRSNFLVATAAMPVMWYALNVHRRREESTLRAGDIVICYATIAACLAPWALLLHQSSDTYLYPIWKGTHRVESDMLLGEATLRQRAMLVIRVLSDMRMVIFIAPAMALLVLIRGRSRIGLALFLVGIVLLIATCFALPFSTTGAIRRYVVHPFLAATAAAGAVAIVHQHRAIRSLTCVALLASIALTVYREARNAVDSARPWTHAVLPNFGPYLDDATAAAYRDAQATLPFGAAAAAAVPAPFAFDRRRNAIHNLDLAGLCGPAPGPPTFRGPAALRDYLLGLDIHYLIFTGFQPGSGGWDRQMWEDTKNNEPSIGQCYRAMSDFADNAATLAREHVVVFERAGLRVVRLDDFR